MKRTFAFVLAAMTALTILPRLGANAAAREIRTITMQIDSDLSLAGLQAVADLAEKKLGIRVEFEYRVGGIEGDNIVKTLLASGDMADICGYNTGSLLESLNPADYFVALNDQEWIGRMDDAYTSTVTVDGAVYGVPIFSMQAGVVLYNRRLYAKHNLEVPNTWAEFIENCRVLQQAGETAMLGTFGDSWTAQVLMLGDYYNVQAQAPNYARQFEAGVAKYASVSAARRSFEKYEDLIGFYNEDYLVATYDDGYAMLAEGQGAHWFMLTQVLSNIYTQYGKEVVDDIGLFAVPSDNGNNGLCIWMPTSMYVNKNSDNVDAALEFLEFYISDEAIDAYSAVQLPDGPYCIADDQAPDAAYSAVAEDMQAYFDAGDIHLAMEFESAVKGPNCMSICVAVASGEIDGQTAAEIYDQDCFNQAIQLGLNW